ncbi:hypothetical protein EOPP23_09055 [Endozoicomonas sp. OPT23]|uniref:GNAT family N-acetyltransferase n=1 Tax=Endozoicomonas sp. OPT23 TaxID=2072845 RepID=UPI00129BF12F|nr:GNAT family N-acetyltransferase [Endozoicomonas sp. OPT23]MRI33130.1 hypothetical protein [Endozoicomonas sp. OPT23]
MIIRKAQEIDMGSIATLCRESLLKAYDNMIDPDRVMPWSEGDDVEKYVRGNWPCMLVAWQDDKLAGLVAKTKNHIDVIWVNEEFRQQGTGKELLAEAERRLAKRYPELTVECIDKETIRFFEKRGYTMQREFTDGMTGVNKTIMGRSLLQESNQEELLDKIA